MDPGKEIHCYDQSLELMLVVSVCFYLCVYPCVCVVYVNVCVAVLIICTAFS